MILGVFVSKLTSGDVVLSCGGRRIGERKLRRDIVLVSVAKHAASQDKDL